MLKILITCCNRILRYCNMKLFNFFFLYEYYNFIHKIKNNIKIVNSTTDEVQNKLNIQFIFLSYILKILESFYIFIIVISLLLI